MANCFEIFSSQISSRLFVSSIGKFFEWICVKLYTQDGHSRLHFYLGLWLTVGYCIKEVRCSVLAFYGNISTEYVKMCHFICIYAIRRRAGFYLIVKQLLQYTMNNSSQCSRIQKIVHLKRNVEYFNVFLRNCSYYIKPTVRLWCFLLISNLLNRWDLLHHSLVFNQII